MGYRIEYGLMVLVAVVAHIWYMHQRAVWRAERRGGPRPSTLDTARQLFIMLIAGVIGTAGGWIALFLLFKYGSQSDALVNMVGAFAIGCLVAGLCWVLLACLGERGPQVGIVLAAGTIGVALFAVVLPGMERQRGKAEPAGMAAAFAPPVRVVDHEHAPEGKVPVHLLEVSPAGQALLVANRSAMPLSISVNKVLRRAGSSLYDRCLMAVERPDPARTGSSLPAVTLEFKPQVASGTSVIFAAGCEPRFHDAPLEFRIETAAGKTLFLSDSAFLE